MAKKAVKKPSFESALERLEAIVDEMEGESLPLEALLSNYEEGNELLKHCQAIINDARKRIEIVHINQSEETENKLATDDSSGETPSSKAAQPPDDIRLL